MKRFFLFVLVASLTVLILRSVNQHISTDSANLFFAHGRKDCTKFLDLEEGLYVEYFPNNKIRRMGHFEVASLKLDTEDHVNLIEYMHPLGYWYKFDGEGMLLSKCLYSDELVVGTDSCVLDELGCIFWTIDFVPVHCQKIE